MAVIQTMDFRQSLRSNRLRTAIVIVLFIAIYVGIGLLVDVTMCTEKYPTVPIETILYALFTFTITPLATISMCFIAAISILVTYAYYDKLMLLGTEYHEVRPDDFESPEEAKLYHVVEEMKIAAGLNFMPKVYIIEANYMNAFASGYSEQSAMVAITRGLMQKLDRDELQAVMAHELSHIRHGDIKLTLTATLLANLSIIVIDIFFRNLFYSRRSSNSRSSSQFAFVVILLRFLLPIITMILLLYLSRKRELMADAGCVELMRNNQPLGRALVKISDDYDTHREEYKTANENTAHENVRRSAYLFDPTAADIKSLASAADIFSTHPSLEERLKALGYKK